MKKKIPEKIANIVYDVMLAGKKNLDTERRNWTYNTLYKPDTCKISNRFFKDKVTLFIFIDKDDWFHGNKQISTTRRTQSFLSKYNDYLQERPEHIRFNGKIYSQSRKF